MTEAVGAWAAGGRSVNARRAREIWIARVSGQAQVSRDGRGPESRQGSILDPLLCLLT